MSVSYLVTNTHNCFYHALHLWLFQFPLARQRALRHIYIHLIEVRAIYASLVSVFLESRRKKNRMKGIFEKK